MENIEEKLCNKTILLILQGNTPVGYLTKPNSPETMRLQMPYLSGPDICSLANKFGIPLQYDGGLSRWQYMYNLISGCIKSGKLSKLFGYLFSKNHVAKSLECVNEDSITEVWQRTVEAVIECINTELSFGDVELVKVGERYEVREVGNTFVPETTKIEQIDSEYIQRLKQRSLEDIQNSDFDGAISKARTLLEEVFCLMIERCGETAPDKGDIIKLYNKVKELYDMHESKECDARINDLLSGINKIVDSISRMRNISGDSHGLGNRRISVSKHHAVLVLNTSCCLADFMLSVCENKTSRA